MGFAPACDLNVEINRPDGSVDSTMVTTDSNGNLAFSYGQTGLIGDYLAHLRGQDGVELMGVGFTAGPLIKLDKGDYRDGETVGVTGLSFFPYEDITVRVTRPDGSVVKSDGAPGSDAVTTDAAGDFAYGYVIRDGVMAKYSVDALDQGGATVASAAFTDSATFLGNFGVATQGSGFFKAITIGNNCYGSTCSSPASVVTAPAGSSVIVAVGVGSGTGAFCAVDTVTNPSGACCKIGGTNVFTADVVVNPTGTTGGLMICSLHNLPSALTSSSTITAYFGSNGNGQAATANVFTGLTAAPLDKTASNNNSASTSLTTSTTATTSQADELLFATFTWANTCSGGHCSDFTHGLFDPGSLTATPTQTNSSNPSFPNTVNQGSTNTSRRLGAQFGIATSMAAYSASATLDNSRIYTQGIATYKIAATQYTVTFDANGGTGSMSPQTSSVAANLTANAFTRTNYTFTGWNTAANGSGTAYADQASYPFTASVTLYAQWTLIPTYSVTYNGNGSTSGAPPTDSNTYATGATVTVLGANTLLRTGYSFAGWNTMANGTGDAYVLHDTFTMGSGNVTLYAQWTQVTYSVTYYGNGNTSGTAPSDPNTYPMGQR